MENRWKGQRLDKAEKRLTVQVSGQGGLHQGSGCEGGKNGPFSGSILKIQLTVFTGIRCGV